MCAPWKLPLLITLKNILRNENKFSSSSKAEKFFFVFQFDFPARSLLIFHHREAHDSAYLFIFLLSLRAVCSTAELSREINDHLNIFDQTMIALSTPSRLKSANITIIIDESFKIDFYDLREK